MKKSNLFPSLACLLTAGLLVAPGCGGGDSGDTGEDFAWQGKVINIGSIFSTTGDGAAFGPQQVKGAELAIENINEDIGVNGADLKLTQLNDKSDPAKSATAMKNLVDDEVLAVLGPTFSNSAAEADPVANQKKTPVLAVSNTGPGIVGDCPYPCEYVFRDSLGEADAIPANIREYSEEVKPETAAIIHPGDDPFAETSAGTAKKAFAAEKVKVVEDTTYPAGLKAVVKSKPDAVMVTASSGELVVEIIKALRKKGFTGQILGGNAFNSTTTSATLGGTGVGAQSAAAWYAGNESDTNKEFIQDYQDKYGVEPDQFAAQAYTGVVLLAAAARAADLSFKKKDVASDRKALKKALEGVKEETPLGDFKFTKDHDVFQPIWVVQMNGQGGFKLIKELPPE